ncbi:aromatic amino acid hydrolase [Cystoisospora suis]|uniref:phenylalanine 4-monooxygenase n=1 Tax=Cystoisospora suis TaxID=483139 RepID=A0A2C6KZA8_9APIC|nr:aromatic amino acid hydrolase [Cystoisospora suis]
MASFFLPAREMGSSALFQRPVLAWSSLVGSRSFPPAVSTFGRETYPLSLIGQQRFLFRDSTPSASPKHRWPALNSRRVLLPPSYTVQGPREKYRACSAAFGSTWCVMGGRAANSSPDGTSDAGLDETRETVNGRDSGEEAGRALDSSDESSVVSADIEGRSQFSGRAHVLRDGIPISTVSCEIEDRVGALCELLTMFTAYKLNITDIASTPNPLDMRKMTFAISFEGDWEAERVQQLVHKLQSHCAMVSRGRPPNVPWFPRCPEDLDKIASQTLDAGKDLEADHPGFHDPVYRSRREEIARMANDHRAGQPVGLVSYTPEEVSTWKQVWNTLTELYPTRACDEFNHVLSELREAGLYGPDRLPQVAEVNEYIKSKTGFTLRPVAGLLAARDFMNALAFRVFFSTQYIRHHSAPLYTPEPDVIHELLGHAPLLANPDFADFSQLLGIASLGCSEEDSLKLQRCYWFSVEFGLLLEAKKRSGLTAYGAGLLSSPGELQHATSPTNSRLRVHRWRPEEAARQQFPITTFQPVLYAADSLEDVRDKLLTYIQNHIHKPFSTRYDSEKGTIQVTTDVRSMPLSMQF